MSDDLILSGKEVLKQHELSLGAQSLKVLTAIEKKPGAELKPMFAPRGSVPLVFIYNVMGKMFAILGVRDDEGVILKCDPNHVLMLREQYEGVGHRSHLDKRYWISVKFDSDVPLKVISQLVDESYDLVCAKLTKKQQAELAALSS